MIKHVKVFLFLAVVVLANTLTAQTVYVTKTGEKYHKSNCRYLKYSKKEIQLKEALDYGYVACAVCKPSEQLGTSFSAKSNSLTASTSSKSYPKKSIATQCTGKTKLGSRCKRKTKSANGRCYQH